MVAGSAFGCTDPGSFGTSFMSDERTSARMDFTAMADFYAAPFPGEHRRTASGAVALTAFPNPDHIELVGRILRLLEPARYGFGTTSGIFFSLTGPIDPAGLPDVPGSMRPDARVFLMDVDPASPEALVRRPIKAGFAADGGPFGAPNLLAMLPYQGVPLRPSTLYSAVIMRSLSDASGERLGAPESLRALLSGELPEGLSAAAASDYRLAIEQLESAGVDRGAIAGLTVFRTGAPAAELETVLAHALEGPLPAPAAPLALTAVYDDYCVFMTTIEMPSYQAGSPPYATEGGGWAFDGSGLPEIQAMERAEMTVTLPRRLMPPAGFPVVITARSGLDSQAFPVPLVSIGPRPEPGVPALPGTGLALTYALAGFAGLMIDAPHTGLRNVTKGDSQFLTFNVQNPEALRDNVRQAAVELALQAHIVKTLRIDASGCPGLSTVGGPARLDRGTIAALGSSTGATILPLAVAHEPLLRAAILTGAGSSYIDNILYKEKPVPTRRIAEWLLDYPKHGRELSELDPILSILQWGADPADPPSYAGRILAEPGGAEHHVLMIQGVVDRYILPPMANATALSMRLDLAGAALDEQAEELSAFAPFLGVAFLSGGVQRAYPASGNIEAPGLGPRTAVMVQHPEDGIEDGHVVLFQTEGPKYQLKCFLESFAKGVPVVPGPARLPTPCR
jgi:hypothetical protein